MGIGYWSLFYGIIHLSLRRLSPSELMSVSYRRILLGALNRLPGHKREFSLTDITIQYPFTNEHVPPWLLFAVSLFTPLLFVAMVGGFVYRNKWDVHNGVLGEYRAEPSVWLKGVSDIFHGMFDRCVHRLHSYRSRHSDCQGVCCSISSCYTSSIHPCKPSHLVSTPRSDGRR